MSQNNKIILLSSIIAVFGVIISSTIAYYMSIKTNETAISSIYLDKNISELYEREKIIFEKKILEFSNFYVNKDNDINFKAMYFDNGESALKEIENLKSKIGKNCAILFALGTEKESLLSKDISNSYLKIYTVIIDAANQLSSEANSEKRKKIIIDMINNYTELRKSISKNIGLLEFEIRKSVSEFQNRQYQRQPNPI